MAITINVESSELLEIFHRLSCKESYNINELKIERLKGWVIDMLINLINLANKFDVDILKFAE